MSARGAESPLGTSEGVCRCLDRDVLVESSQPLIIAFSESQL
jgi:hypothetical protein